MTQIDRGTAHNLTPLRLVLVEDHAILRDSLKALIELETDVAIVAEYGCAESSLDGILRLQPDLVVVDLALPNGSGIGLIGEIQRLSPRSRKLVLTGSNSAEHIRAALYAGADGYVLKDSTRAELMLAIRTVSLGQRFLCGAIAGKILTNFLAPDEPQSPSPHSRVTLRERQVITRIAHGHSNKMIARELGLSPKTVAKHRANLMRKLHLHNTAAITMYAMRNGLAGIDIPEMRATTQLTALA